MKNSEKPFIDLPQGEVSTTSVFGQTLVGGDFAMCNNLADAAHIFTPDRTPQLATSHGWRDHKGVGAGYADSYGDVTTASARGYPDEAVPGPYLSRRGKR